MARNVYLSGLNFPASAGLRPSLAHHSPHDFTAQWEWQYPESLIAACSPAGAQQWSGSPISHLASPDEEESCGWRTFPQARLADHLATLVTGGDCVTADKSGEDGSSATSST